MVIDFSIFGGAGIQPTSLKHTRQQQVYLKMLELLKAGIELSPSCCFEGTLFGIY